ncbi:MAG TPA: hypothetical protein VKE49_05405, partial [Myxococcaceae bacterium]|nr:hypothetical protein [Myxococcaceae bacterium]
MKQTRSRHLRKDADANLLDLHEARRIRPGSGPGARPRLPIFSSTNATNSPSGLRSLKSLAD